MASTPVVAVHGINNLQAGRTPTDAADILAKIWQTKLAAGYAASGLAHETVPKLRVAYYAHLLAHAEEQGLADSEQVESLSEDEAVFASTLLQAAGSPVPMDSQGLPTTPLRQALNLLAIRHGVTAEILGRVVVAFAREVYAYLTHPEDRREARAVVADTLREHRPHVVIAHSLGSVVTYEALHAHSDVEVDLLLTLGSPLGLRGAVFDALEPKPIAGRGVRPPRISRWVNLADPGDLIALPRRLGDRFPVDLHAEAHIGAIKFHTLSSYLARGLTASAMAPYAR